MSKELKELLEERAQAVGNLAYLRAKSSAKIISRLHSQKSLYFVSCGDAVKIGISNNPQARIEALQTGAPGPLKLIASIPNAGSKESECHRALNHLRIHGEWFWYTEEVDRLIEELK